MKKILVDLYKTKDIYSGLGQFSMNFYNQIEKTAPAKFKISFLIPKGFDKVKNNLVAYINVSFFKRYFCFTNRGFDVWHSLHQFPSHLPSRKTKLILTIHDLNFLIEKNERKTRMYLEKLQKNVDRATCITTISNYSKSIIEQNVNLKGKKVNVIYNGIELKAFENAQQPDYVTGDKFFFSIGIFNDKKNFKVLLPLLNHFTDYKLIIAGNCSTSYGKFIKELILDMNLSDRVILPGMISDSDKYWLYKNCKAFLFPSLAEGFGMPVIEAMKTGAPVFLSKFTSLPEIGGDKAFYFDSFEADEMCSVIENCLQYYNSDKQNISNEIIEYANTFSWENCINQYLKLYDSLI